MTPQNLSDCASSSESCAEVLSTDTHPHRNMHHPRYEEVKFGRGSLMFLGELTIPLMCEDTAQEDTL